MRAVRKLLNIFEFYKSTLPINLGISLLPAIYLGLDGFLAVFLTFGFVSSIMVKEVRNKETYLFYSNNGLSKMLLWIVSSFLNILLCIILLLLTKLTFLQL